MAEPDFEGDEIEVSPPFPRVPPPSRYGERVLDLYVIARVYGLTNGSEVGRIQGCRWVTAVGAELPRVEYLLSVTPGWALEAVAAIRLAGAGLVVRFESHDEMFASPVTIEIEPEAPWDLVLLSETGFQSLGPIPPMPRAGG